MTIVLFLLTSLLVLLGALAGTLRLRLSDLVSRLLALFVLALAQVVLSLLLAGVVFERLQSGPVLFIHVLFTTGLMLASRSVWWPTRAVDQPHHAVHQLAASGRSLREAVRAGWQHWWARLLLVLFVGHVCWLLLRVYYFPPYAWDALAYHLTTAGIWLQEGRIALTPFVIWTNVYPHNGALLYTWLMLFGPGDTLVDLGQLLFAAGGVLAVCGLGRMMGLSRAGALAAGCLFFLTPIVLAQSNTNYVDVALAAMFAVHSYFVLRSVQQPGLAHMLLAGLAGGLTLGIKSTGLAYIGISSLWLVVLLGVGVLRQRPLLLAPGQAAPGATHWPVARRAVVGWLAVYGVCVLLLGSFWYARTWVAYGSPIYPYSISLLDYTLFAGDAEVQALELEQTPLALRELPRWQQVARSWFSEPTFTIYDQRLGGLGLQWVYLQLPALLVVLATTLWRRRVGFLVLALPFILAFLVQPANWWSRFTIVLVVPGAIAVVVLLEQLQSRRSYRWLASYALILVALSSLLSLRHSGITTLLRTVQQTPAERTIGALYYPEFAWVDQVPDGARIGMHPGHHSFAYPLLGQRLQHRVVALRITRQAALHEKIRSQELDYLFVREQTDYDRWLRQAPDRFCLIDTHWRMRVYRVGACEP